MCTAINARSHRSYDAITQRFLSFARCFDESGIYGRWAATFSAVFKPLLESQEERGPGDIDGHQMKIEVISPLRMNRLPISSRSPFCCLLLYVLDGAALFTVSTLVVNGS
jgi:hypothetical protein